MPKTTVTLRLVAAAALSLIAGAPEPTAAQSLATRVTRVRSGTVRMSYASRPDVCGNGRGNISTTSSSRSGRRDEWEDECEHGPVRVALDVADGHVIAIRAYVGGRWKASGDATDLGMVGVREATEYLLGTVVRDGGRAARDAIFPATIADSVTTWPRLLDIARDDDVERGTRTQAVFWIGQAAGERATAGLRDVADDVKVDREVRKQAVFRLKPRTSCRH